MDLKEASTLIHWVNDPTMTTLDKETVKNLVNFLAAQIDSAFLQAVLRFNYSNPRRKLPEQLGFASDEELSLAYRLIREETRETFEAIDERDYVKAVDGGLDLQYVVFNLLGALGLHHHGAYEACFMEVHRSNMTKLFPDGSVHQREDGKILKPEKFEAPKLRELLMQRGWRK